MDKYFPMDGTITPGAQVRPVFADSFREQIQKFTEAIQKLSPEKRAESLKNITLDQVPAYNADIWPNKEDYNQFAAEWSKVQLQKVSPVGVGFQALENGLWRVVSATANLRTKEQAPLILSTLRYDANRNVWISPNGELTAKDYSAPETSIYGAQTGTEWTLEKKDTLSNLRETVRISKTTDGKNVYVAYSLAEQSALTGSSIAQGAFLLQFPVQKASAKLGTPGQR